MTAFTVSPDTGSMLRHQFLVAFAFARSAFLRLLAYRVRYIVGVANYFLYVSVNYYLLLQVKLSNRDALPAFADRADIFTYMVVAWAARAAYYNNVDWMISQQVTSGQLAMTLVRPAPFPWITYWETAGETVFRACFMSLPAVVVLAVAYWPNFEPPAGLLPMAACAFSLVLSFHLYFALNFLTGILSVVTKKAEGFIWSKFVVIQLLSGVMLPLTMFPDWAVPILLRSPFAGLSHTPVFLYQGALTGAEAADALAWQVGWTVALTAAVPVGWRLVARKISIQGG